MGSGGGLGLRGQREDGGGGQSGTQALEEF